MNFPKFLVFTYSGSLVWSVALTLTGYYLGEAWTTFSDEASSAFTLVSVAVIAAIVGTAGIWYVRRKKRTTPREKQ
jgi:membrane protein DedA with SNARE-associated domain